MDYKDTERQEKRVKEVPKVKVTSRFLRADQSLTSSDSSSTRQNKVMEDANWKMTDSSGISDSKVNIQTEITKTILCAEPEVKRETHFVTTITDPSKATAAEVKEETETVISAQINCTEDSIQAKNQEPAQVVSLSLETPKETVRDAGEEVTVSIVSGSHVPGSLEAQTKVSADLTLVNDSIRIDLSSALSDASSSEKNNVIEDADTRSGTGGVYGGSLGLKCSLSGSPTLLRNGKEEGPVVAINPARNLQHTGRYSSRGGADWMVYSGSLGHQSGSLPSTGSTESLPTALDLETSSSETRKFGSRGSGEWRVYGGSTGRMSSWAGSSSLANADKEETPQLPTSTAGQQRAGKFGIEKSTSTSVVPATSLPELRSSITGSGSLPNTVSTESLPTALDLETSSSVTRKFGSRGSGEWRVYGGSTGRMSSWAGSSSLANVDKEETPQLPTSTAGLQRAGKFGSAGSEKSTSTSVVPATSLPELRSSITGSGSLPNTVSTESLPTALDLETSSSGTRKFGSRGSGEWRVYGGSTGRISSWAGSSSLANADKEETPQLPTSTAGHKEQRSLAVQAVGSGEFMVGVLDV
ncbi:hypothetical protein D5F01_LYC25292 [Larimichthys crocea]|uniref:Uncharacterized protein n=1 Tax=Larimichthys crocea TaxID=215358 RepID=A0A6G0HD53_LARCR|nr:hypothetical protein D5F01_LYC25292 [Larimichthys crocea]